MADLIIRGMEMPKRCVGCPLFVCEIGDPMSCLVGYRRLDERNVNKSRPDWCPLYELPTPHGRLIDADKIPYVESEDGCLNDYAFAYDIREMPTIVDAEGGGEDG